MSRVLIMGAYGLLGTRLSSFLYDSGWDVIRQGRMKDADTTCDPTSLAEVTYLIRSVKPDVVVNLNALTDVDLCEKQPKDAYLANTKTVEVLVKALENSNIHLVHISTDQLYDGRGPHDERVVTPINVYAITKYAAELLAEKSGATLLRTNFVGQSLKLGKVAFTDWITSTLKQGEAITLFDDVFFSALHVKDLCKCIELSIMKKIPGTFNLGSRDRSSKAHFGLALAEQLSIDTSKVNVGSILDMKLVATRPLDMSMNVSLFEKEFEITLPTMSQTIHCVAKEYNRG